MAFQPSQSPWTHTVATLLSCSFSVLSIRHLFRPDYFLRRSGMRKGEAMLTHVHRMGFRFVGLGGAALTGFLLFELIGHFFAK